MNRLSIPATSEIPTAFTVPTAHLRTARIEGLKEFFSITKVISLYRIISLVLTSVFYLAGNHQSPLKYKLLLSDLVSLRLFPSLFLLNLKTQRVSLRE